VFSLDFEDGASNSDNAEDCKINPSELLLEAVTKDYDSGEKEDWDVNDKFSIGNGFCSRNHNAG